MKNKSIVTRMKAMRFTSWATFRVHKRIPPHVIGFCRRIEDLPYDDYWELLGIISIWNERARHHKKYRCQNYWLNDKVANSNISKRNPAHKDDLPF